MANTITRRLRAVDQQEGTTATDHAGIARAAALQARFRAAISAFFTAVDRKNRVQAAAIDTRTIEPLAMAMRQLIAVGSNTITQQLTAAMSSLNTTEQDVRAVTVMTFIPGLILLLIFGRLFRGYRRQLEAASRAEVAHLQQYAITDHLTGLGNHRAFAEEEARALRVARRSGEGLALALVDIDDFKQINDEHGHSHGDRVLAALGVLLAGGRAGDRAFRLGGDEFAILMQPASEPEALVVLERLRQMSAQRLFGATISVGVAVLGPGVDDMATLRETADAALYEAKRRGRNATVTFSEIRDTAAILSTTKILAVRRLLAERRLLVVFQPIWRLDRGTILGYEALTRPAAEYGLDGPQDAFDIAERIGRAPELDAVCREAILARAGELPAGVLLFINLSPQSLDHGLLKGDTLVRSFTAAGLAPGQVVLEITERSLARPDVVSREVRRLRDLGFRIALDDVGMGSTGLEMLRLIPLDYLKIDRGIVADALTDTTSRSVLAAILAFARESDTFVIAEGIETEEMLEFVDEAGRASPDRRAHAVQGYLTGRPTPTIARAPSHILLPRSRAVS